MSSDRKELKKGGNWNERYDGGEYSSDGPDRLLAESVATLPGGKAFDLACGSGRDAIFLAENGFQVTAIDNSPVGLEIARKKATEKGLTVDFLCADLEKDDFLMGENAYDLICDFYFLHRALFPQMKVALKSGGMFVAAIHIYGAGEKERRFLLREGELKEIFRDFEILHYQETSSARAEIGRHYRRTAEIIAKKVTAAKLDQQPNK